MTEDPDRLSERLRRLEEALAHQQRWLEQLDEVVVDMRREIDALRGRLDATEHRVRWIHEQRDEPRDLLDEKPPHY